MKDDLTTLLAETKRICEAATPGEWQTGEFDALDSSTWELNELIEGNNCGIAVTIDRGNLHDADFICHARTMLPRLAAALEFAVSQRDGYVPHYKYLDPDKELSHEETQEAVQRQIGLLDAELARVLSGDVENVRGEG